MIATIEHLTLKLPSFSSCMCMCVRALESVHEYVGVCVHAC